MKPVPMIPTPISRIGGAFCADGPVMVGPVMVAQSWSGQSYSDCPPGLGRFEGRIGQTEGLASIPRGDRHGTALLDGGEERVELEPIGVGIALEKEVQERVQHFGLCCAVAPQRSSPEIV